MSFSEDTIREVNKSSRKDLVTMEELKPCPLCNSQPIIQNDRHNIKTANDTDYFVLCPNCNLRSVEVSVCDGTSTLKAISKLVSLWNNRVDDDIVGDDDDDMEADVTIPKGKTNVTVRRVRR